MRQDVKGNLGREGRAWPEGIRDHRRDLARTGAALSGGAKRRVVVIALCAVFWTAVAVVTLA